MEDPWSSGTAWAEPTKAVDRVPSPISTTPIRTPPPARLDTADPWGAPTPIPQDEASASPTFDWQPSPTRNIPKSDDTIAQTPGWGGGWSGEAEAEAGPSRSPPRQPAESPLWGMSGTTNHQAGLKTASPSASPTVEDLDLPAQLSLDSPPLESRGFEVDATQVSPVRRVANLDLEQDIALPTSPKFGEDFGGFSSGFGDDPWGPKKADAAWGASSSRIASPHDDHQDESDDEDTAEDGWGGGQSQNQARAEIPQKSGMDEDWEEAQKRIRVTEARAPREKIVNLQGAWRELAEGVIGLNKLSDPADGDEDAYAGRIRKQDDETYETLRSLSTIPPDTNTYPPVLSAMQTHERYQYALSRPNPTPDTSFLNIASSRRSRRDVGVQDSLESWTSRSRLGEPEALPLEATPQAEEAKPKWSFWRKNTAEKPLVTSGGGILEVKSMASPPIPAPSEPRPSISSAVSGSASKGSRPASPAPAVGPAIDSPSIIPATASSPDPVVPAQSAVTRFFGRLSRKPSSQQAADGEEKDMQLSADDFSFLDQVPSIAGPAPEGQVGDLLAFGGGRTEEMASLESMISSKSVPLPAPLAPPPTWSRSSSSVGFSVNQAKQVNIFDDLDFGSPSNDSYGAAMQPDLSTQTNTATSKSDWDDFLAPSLPSIPSSAVPMMPSASVQRSHSPSIPPSSASPFAMPLQSPQNLASPIAGPSRIQPTRTPVAAQDSMDNDFDDFADFAPASMSRLGDFDDFGDFSDFSTPPPITSQPHQTATPYTGETTQFYPPSSTGHIKRASLDHTMTLNLVKDASATKGKRWPAPPSPLAPQLEPPPKAPGNATNFPFLSPPPGTGRPITAFGDLLSGNVNESITSNSGTVPTPPRMAQQVPFSASAPLMPARTASPLSRPMSAASNTATVGQTKPGQSGQSGLSAQDLSFFDSL